MSQLKKAENNKNLGINRIHILTLIVATILFIFLFIPAINLKNGDITSLQPSATNEVQLDYGRVFKQEIGNYSNKLLKAFSIRFSTFGRINKGKLEVKLFENDDVIASWSVPATEIEDNQLREFALDKPYKMKDGSVYAFTVSDIYRGRNAVGVWMDKQNAQGFYINDQFHNKGTLCYTVLYRYAFSLTWLIPVGYLLMVAGIVLLFFIYSKQDTIAGYTSATLRKLQSKIQIKNTDVTVWDWIVFALLAGFCYFTMQHNDLIHTGASSFALLRGHILDFYEYNAHHLGGNAYMISTYLMFAIWNIPLALLGLMGPPSMNQSYGVLMWFKALPTTLFVLSGLLFYKICKKYEKDAGINAKWATFFFLLTPTAFYSQFMFGQYDVLTVFFMVLGLKLLLDEKKNSMVWFSIMFGFATTFKYHALLFYIPILLYKEKRLPALVKNAIWYALPVVLVNLPYIHSSFFSSGVEEFGAVGYFFTAGIQYYVEGVWKIYLVPLLWVVICVYAYTRKTADRSFDQIGEIAYLTGLVVWLAFGVVFWHPQWIMIATPFLVLGMIVSKRRIVICLADIAFTIAFISFVESIFVGMTQGFYSLGILGAKVAGRQILSPRNLGQFCLLKDSNIAFTTISCLLLARALLLKPEWNTARDGCSRVIESLWFRIRGFIGICIIVVPMIICLISEINTPSLSWTFNPDIDQGKMFLNIQTEAEFTNPVVAVWSDTDGQDDLIWYTVKDTGDNKWQAEIDLKKHNTLGTYFAHFYNYDRGVPDRVWEMSFEINELPKTET